MLIDVTLQVAEVREYMRFRKVPYELQLRVLRYYDYMYQKKFFDEKRIIFAPNMSPILRQVWEILPNICGYGNPDSAFRLRS